VANYKLILKNTTVSAIELDEGIIVPASGQVTIDPTSRRKFWDDIDLIGNLATQIRNGDIVVNDGINDITVANGFSLERAIDYLKFPDRAFNLRFESDPERVNGFESKNVQEAIEEAKLGNIITGRTYQIEFFNNGNTSNKWLFHVPTNEATDQLPYITAWDIEIFGILYTNKNTPTDCDVEFYVNGTNNPNKVYTLQIRNYKTYWETTETSFFTLTTGDSLSIFIKKIGQSTPSSVEIDLNIRITSITTGTGGSL
jgi:hypothetical protein